MPLHEFWHGDMRLLEVYQKAYYRDVSYKCWMQGAYNFEVQSKVSANTNRTKKSDKVYQYEKWKDPFEKVKQKPIITKDNIEEEFRKQRREQQAWLFHK